MSLPWILFQLLAPSLPEIISTIRNLKNQRGDHPAQAGPEARLHELEKALEEHLRLIARLTTAIEKLQKSVVMAVWAAIFALVLSLLALGLSVFR